MAPRKTKPHYTMEVDYDGDVRPLAMDARGLTLPSVAVISVVFASMWLTYFLVNERTRLDNRVDAVVTSVERLATSMSQLAEGLKYGNNDRYTVAQHALWCARTETLNKGFKCAPESSPDIATSTNVLNGTLDSVHTEMDAVSKKLKPQG